MFYSSIWPLGAVVFFFFYTLSSAIDQSQVWPNGTEATASSTHPNNEDGQFIPDKAIDNDATTKWNDNTSEKDPTSAPYPDIFTLSIGSVVKLDGIMLLSGTDGWLRDYTVETSLDGLSWNLSATVKASTVVLRYIKFDNGPLDAKKLRVIITAAKNDFSRIHELSPVYAAVSADTTTTKSSPSPSPSTTTTTTTPITTPAPAEAEAPPAPPSPDNTSKKTKPNTAEIIAGVLAGLAGILLGLQAYILWLLRKKQQRNGSNMISTCMSTTGFGVVEEAAVGGGQTVIIGDDLSHQNNPIIGFSFHTITATSELGGSQQHHSELVGKRYPRAELA